MLKNIFFSFIMGFDIKSQNDTEKSLKIEEYTKILMTYKF
jgi:hypothetical protein